MPVTDILKQGEDKMNKSVLETKKELINVRTGRANPLILDKITVDYYGTPSSLRQVANVAVQDGQTLVITPFDKSVLHGIEKAIMKSDLGVNPNSDGSTVRITFPPLTQDRRKDLVKQVKKLGEEGKVAIRNNRRDTTDALKKIEKSENVSEDEMKKLQDQIQKMTDKHVREIDSLVADKEKEVMSI